MRFADRHPALFHVADRAAIEGIARHGLLSARRLSALYDGPNCLEENRAAYVELAPEAALRRQGLRDGSLRPRLDPAISLGEWRQFINGFVFLFAARPLAQRFVATEPTRDQVVLAWATAPLVDACLDIRVCRYNNGYIDRSPRATARKRTYSDYESAARWSGTPVKEVVVMGGIPPTVRFEVLPSP